MIYFYSLYHFWGNNSSCDYTTGYLSGAWWPDVLYSGIFAEFGNHINYNCGSQTLIIMTTTVMTDKLFIMFMDIHGMVVISVVSFTITIYCLSILQQVLQSNLHIIIVKIVHIVVICLFSAEVHHSGLYQQVGVVYSEVVAMHIVLLTVVNTLMLNM